MRPFFLQQPHQQPFYLHAAVNDIGAAEPVLLGLLLPQALVDWSQMHPTCRSKQTVDGSETDVTSLAVAAASRESLPAPRQLQQKRTLMLGWSGVFYGDGCHHQ
jgi:hypothetical protein